MNLSRTLSRLLLGLLPVVLTGCGIFGGDKDESLEPQELRDFQQNLPVKRAWSAKLGDSSEFLRLALSPDGNDERIYAASRDGVVSAFEPATGQRLWRTELKLPLSAGPGFGADTVVVAGSSGQIVALRAGDGSQIWQTTIGRETLAKPLITGDSIVVYSIDGTLRVLNRFNGRERWSIEQTLPPLTLRGSSSPAVVGQTVIAGFDNGRLVATNMDDGTPIWEVVLSPPTGRSDLERLADVDGPVAVVGQDIYASAYQGRLAALAAESGQALWTREISSFVGVGADTQNVYVASDSGEVLALSRSNGNERWRNDALLRRGPTTIVPFNDSVVVGDFDGYVHFFSKDDGSTVARVRVGKGMLSGPPVVIGDRLYLQSESGRLDVFAIDRPERSDDT
ncbi:MAG: outer membrane protein assembly factor BamB [Woeseia sp.]